jgi:hypothetical protein
MPTLGLNPSLSITGLFSFYAGIEVIFSQSGAPPQATGARRFLL